MPERRRTRQHALRSLVGASLCLLAAAATGVFAQSATPSAAPSATAAPAKSQTNGQTIGQAIAIINPGFEEPATGARAPGWLTGQHWGPKRDYEWAVDTTVAAEGKASYRIRRLSPQAYGMIHQQVDVTALAGKTLELSAQLRTEDVGPEGWLLVVNIDSRHGILEQLRGTPVTGTTGWRRETLRFKLPAEATDVKLGVMLLDGGTGWIDDVALRSLD